MFGLREIKASILAFKATLILIDPPLRSLILLNELWDSVRPEPGLAKGFFLKLLWTRADSSHRKASARPEEPRGTLDRPHLWLVSVLGFLWTWFRSEPESTRSIGPRSAAPLHHTLGRR